MRFKPVVLMIALLMTRPTGLLGKQGYE